MADVLLAGKRVYVPFCPVEDPTVMRMLRLRDEVHFSTLPLNRWGIRELAPAEVSVTLRIVRLPMCGLV